MFQWSNKVSKSIAFDQQELSDQALLTAIETELAKYPDKSFSDVCKEALKAVFVPEFAPSGFKSKALEPKWTELQSQLTHMEQRLLTREREAGRLDLLERQVQQLTFQLAQLGVSPPPVLPSEPAVQPPSEDADWIDEAIDPILSHLSAIADDF